jgi:hypothetical protein
VWPVTDSSSYNFYRKEGGAVNRIAVLLAAGLAACATTDPPESEMATRMQRTLGEERSVR